jgi:hypothetical protein
MARVDLSYQRRPTLPLNESELMVALGPVLGVEIGFDPTYDPGHPDIVPKLAATDVRALIDTGAMMSYIDLRLAKTLQLPEIDKEEKVIPVLGGPQEITTYLGQIFIPSLSLTINGHFGGLDLVNQHFNVAAILGREFLMNCVLSYDGMTGRVVLGTI